MYDENPKPEKQLKKALTDNIPLILWIGENELKDQSVKVKKTKRKPRPKTNFTDIKTTKSIHENLQNIYKLNQ